MTDWGGEQALCPAMQTGSGALGDTACLAAWAVPSPSLEQQFILGTGSVPILADCKSQAVVLAHERDVVVGTDGWLRSVRCCLDVTCRSTAMLSS